MTDEQIKYMVNRFLGWSLPENFSPDGGVSFRRHANEGTVYERVNRPSGTNLLDAVQAEAMVRHLVEGMPQPILVTVVGNQLRDQHGNVVGSISQAT